MEQPFREFMEDGREKSFERLLLRESSQDYIPESQLLESSASNALAAAKEKIKREMTSWMEQNLEATIGDSIEICFEENRALFMLNGSEQICESTIFGVRFDSSASVVKEVDIDLITPKRFLLGLKS